ncbi:MAG TPA: PDZ domain-containing protein, partial [Thermoanaerobaculia bacterium]|nr:PDZ domain-containing protein [Thermoanaerobaculia bacterium]
MLSVKMVTALKFFGALAFALAALSIVDMFLPRPYDGVVLESDAYSELRVRQVVPGTGAAQAGIHHGDVIVGIGREILRSPAHAARQLNRYRIGEIVPYLIRDASGIHEVEVRLGHRQIGDRSYLYACLLGFSFFFVGLFVLRRHPAQHANQLFFILCTLFMLFLICRLRPASYSQVDTFVLATGTLALVVLPSAFLDFYLSFPRPRWHFHKPRWLPRGLVLAVIYALPPVLLLASLASNRSSERPPLLISGAPAANWWILAIYMVLGLLALGWNAAALKGTRERRGAWLVLAGSLFGLGPFLVLAVAFPSLLHTERFLFYGVVPLLLVPLTFAYSIVRFQLLDIQVILKKSLLYTVTTATLTALYAVAIASFNSLFGGTELADSRWSPILLGLAIVLLFDPVRRRLQVAIDRFFAAERFHLQRAMVEIGGTFAADDDLQGAVVRLVERLPHLIKVGFAALYLKQGDQLLKVTGPSHLPSELEFRPDLHRTIDRTEALPRIGDLLHNPILGSRESLILRHLSAGGA